MTTPEPLASDPTANADANGRSHVGNGTSLVSGTSRTGSGLTFRRQRRVWSSRVDSWSSHGSVGLERVTQAVVEAVAVRPGEHVVDLGCGTGAITLEVARQGARVLAVDVSAGMVRRLGELASGEGIEGVEGMVEPIERLALPAMSTDAVVSSYALHHLRDPDKARVVEQAYTWIRPGGRIVIADMMFGRGGSKEDRAIFASKLRILAKKGPGGWWRIAKNAGRLILRIQERPISLDAWQRILVQAGFADVSGRYVRQEAGMVTGRRPDRANGSTSGR